MNEIAIISIALWAYVSVQAEYMDMLQLAIVTLLLLMYSVAVRLVSRIMDIDSSVLRIVLVLNAIGMLVGYSYGEIGEVLETVFYSGIAFIVVWVIGKLGLYRFKIIGLGCLVLMVALLLLTRIIGTAKNNAYLSMGDHVLTIGLLLLLMPFANAYLLTNEVERNTVSVKSLPLNQIFMLIFTLIIAGIAGFLNNDYGTVLLICGVSGILFLIYGRNLLTKFLLSAITLFGTGVITLASEKVRRRILIVTDIHEAMKKIATEAQPVKYIQDTVRYFGWYGIGNGELSEKVFKNVTSDYVWSGLLFNTGLLFSVLTIVLFILLIAKILKIDVANTYDRVIADSYAIVIGLMVLFPFAGCLGILPLSGIGTAFISVAKTVNIALIMLLGIIMEIERKGNREYDYYST